MDWSTPLEAIRTAVAAAAALPDRAIPATGRTHRRVEWGHRRTAARVVTGQWVDLHVRTVAGLGRDETRYEFDAPGYDPGDPTLDRNTPVVTGNRRISLSVHARSDSQEPGSTAGVLADRIRTGLRKPSVEALLRAGGVGFEGVELAVTHDYVDSDDRWVSEAVLEVMLLLAVNDRDEATTGLDAAGAWVERADGTGTLSTDHTGADVSVVWDSDLGEP